jgi:nitrite reductase/ring-hydroxylating ferredoxin subunit
MCPWHQWRFDLHTGCSPVNPSSKVNRYRVRVEGDAIWVDV